MSKTLFIFLLKTRAVTQALSDKYQFPVDALKEEFIRFADFKVIEGQFDLLSSPFACDIETATEELQMELIDLQADNSLRGCLKVNHWSSFIHLCTQKSFKI